jgi:hypothetical protein
MQMPLELTWAYGCVSQAKADPGSFRQAIGDANPSPQAHILSSSFLDNCGTFGIIQIQLIPVLLVISQRSLDLLEEIVMICSRKVSPSDLLGNFIPLGGLFVSNGTICANALRDAK